MPSTLPAGCADHELAVVGDAGEGEFVGVRSSWLARDALMSRSGTGDHSDARVNEKSTIVG